jgi:uncharacterized protein
MIPAAVVGCDGHGCGVVVPVALACPAQALQSQPGPRTSVMQQHTGITSAVGPAEAGAGESAAAVRVKVVPGASRSKVVGMLGDRLKLAVSAPPEGGKANKAVCRLLAEALGVPARGVVVSAGTSKPQKTLTVTGLSARQVVERLAPLVAS